MGLTPENMPQASNFPLSPTKSVVASKDKQWASLRKFWEHWPDLMGKQLKIFLKLQILYYHTLIITN